jgi:hypothetical protein
MSEDRETSHEMTNRDIALLLADAADEVEIGIAPYQQVVRGGRRRRTRRYLVAAAAAVVIAGSTGTLALAGGFGGDGDRVEPAATRPPTAEQRHVYAPQVTTLAQGSYEGEQWTVTVEVWGAPHNQEEALRQSRAFTAGHREPPVDKPSQLVGKTSFFAVRQYGDTKDQQIMFDTVEKIDRLRSTDMENAATRFSPSGKSSGHLVIGEVAKTAKALTCRWKDGTSTVARLVTGATPVNETDVIRPVAGFTGGNWFVCVAPSDTSYLSANVTG